MAVPISITETQIFSALGSVLGTYGMTAAAGPSVAVPIILGQTNRVPQVQQDDFVVMWSLSRHRLATNQIDLFDNSVRGAIAGNVLNVLGILNGSVPIGQPIYGPGVTAGCEIIAQIDGVPNGTGHYSTTQTADVARNTLYIGATTHMQRIEFAAQVDVHGPASADNVTRISTLWRDQFTVSGFQDIGYEISPLYCSDPRQMAFTNEERQTENRWAIDLSMQINPTVTTTAQFAAQLIATVVSVETLGP